jgi:SAM-dependent methyltransferase
VPTLTDRWSAWLISHVSGAYDALLAERKRGLLSGLRGTVLEIGPGTGANLKYYAPEIRWIGFEPNPAMHPFLRREAAACHRSIDARQSAAESMDFESGSADAVVSTAVLCSAGDVVRCLAEIRRVLKPGGKFVFIEHVVAPRGSALRLVQHAVGPVWSCCAGGCHPDRDTAAHIERAGFGSVELERFRLPLGPVAPHIAGVAIR